MSDQSVSPDRSRPCVNCGYGITEHDPKNGWCFNGGTGEDASQYEPKPTVAGTEDCEMCGNTGFVQVPHVERVTHDMALDACMPELEGEEMSWGNESVPCPACEERRTP